MSYIRNAQVMVVVMHHAAGRPARGVVMRPIMIACSGEMTSAK